MGAGRRFWWTGRSRRAAERGERGGALVELAIVAPLFVLFVVGVVDLGRVLLQHMAMTDLVKECVRISQYTYGVSTLDGCQCDWVSTDGVESFNGSNCTTQTYDTEIWSEQFNGLTPANYICGKVDKIFSVLRSNSDVWLKKGTLRIELDYPGPTADHWQCEIYGTFEGLFPAQMFNNSVIRVNAVGTALGDIDAAPGAITAVFPYLSVCG